MTTTTTSSLLSMLTGVLTEKLAMRQRHVAVARLVADYNFNNTYQQIISREDVHLAWLEAAVLDEGGALVNADEPTLALAKGASAAPLIGEDARTAGAFVDRWRPRLGEIGNARHRNMVSIVLGETLEQKRFFDQMVSGREDVLGRRANGDLSPGTGNGVLPVRWIE